MFYEMKRDESVGSLLEFAGGFAGDAYTKNVRLVRKSGRDYQIFNVDELDFSSFHLMKFLIVLNFAVVEFHAAKVFRVDEKYESKSI